MNKQILIGLAALVAAFSTNLSAEEFTIKASGMSFKSDKDIKKTAVIVIQPGDTVTWIELTSGGHDTTSMEGLIPEGAETWQSTAGVASLTHTFEQEGLYIYKCSPHVSQGMAAGIIVGNIDDYKSPEKLQAMYYLAKEIGGADAGPAKRVMRKLAKALGYKLKNK